MELSLMWLQPEVGSPEGLVWGFERWLQTFDGLVERWLRVSDGLSETREAASEQLALVDAEPLELLCLVGVGSSKHLDPADVDSSDQLYFTQSEPVKSLYKLIICIFLFSFFVILLV
jgi:hypothetical protein